MFMKTYSHFLTFRVRHSRSHLPSPCSIAADGLWQFRQPWAWRVFARGYRAARRGGGGPPTLVCAVGLDVLFLVKQSQKTPSLELLTKGPGFFGLSLFLLRIRSMKKINKGHPHTHTMETNN